MIDRFDLPAVQETLKSLLQHHNLKASILRCLASFMDQLSHLYMTTGKTRALAIQTFFWQSDYSTFSYTVLVCHSFSCKEQVSFNFIATIAVSSDFGAQENIFSHYSHFFPIYLWWSDETGCHDLHFWMLSFKPTFWLSSFTFIKRLFSSLLSAIRVVSSAYLRLLMFLPVILIPACASSSPAFLMMYSA